MYPEDGGSMCSFGMLLAGLSRITPTKITIWTLEYIDVIGFRLSNYTVGEMSPQSLFPPSYPLVRTHAHTHAHRICLNRKFCLLLRWKLIYSSLWINGKECGNGTKNRSSGNRAT